MTMADKIAFDCCDRSDPAYPISHTVTLHRKDDGFLEGNFQYMESGEKISGPVRCRLYSNTNGFALIGSWIEKAAR